MQQAMLATSLKIYIATYNQLNGLGWLYVLLDILSRGFYGAGTRLGSLVFALQVLVLLDVVHAACGLWPSDPMIGMLQRLWCKVGHRSEICITLLGFADSSTLEGWTFGFLLFT